MTALISPSDDMRIHARAHPWKITLQLRLRKAVGTAPQGQDMESIDIADCLRSTSALIIAQVFVADATKGFLWKVSFQSRGCSMNFPVLLDEDPRRKQA
jgi:hypothetical protein